MKVEQARVVLRARSSSEVLDLALRFVIELQPGLYVRLAVITLLPALTLCAWVWWSGVDWVWTWILALGLGTVMQGVFTVAAGRLMFSEDVPAREVLRHFIGRLPTYAGALMLSRLVLALSAVAVITLPVAAAHLALIHEAVLLENATVGQSHRRASRIARHRASRAALVPAATVGVTGASIVVCELLGQALVQSVLQFGEPFGTLWDSGGSLYALAGYFVSIPLVATARFLFYIDGRTLRDGWDIQIRFMRIQVEAEGRAA